MADSKLASPRAGTASPPPNCAICLGTCTNKCYSDSCMHEFCFKCLLEWSKIKAECPLCKQTFKSIIHNIRSGDEYDEHIVENITVEENRYLESNIVYLPPSPPALHHQYHFRTTFTVDTHGEHAIQQMLLSHPLLTLGTYAPERYQRRRRADTSTTFRRIVYRQNLWVFSPPDINGRYRDVSPDFYRRNPASRTRLVPWLNRELNALLYENTQLVMHLVDIILDHLLRIHICSTAFRTLLSEYLDSRTDHFIHEFYNFMRSPLDMIGYDRHVIYTEQPTSTVPHIDISDYDSDVIFVNPTSSNNNQQESQRDASVVIDLVDTDSDEPIIVSEERNGPNSRVPEDDNNRKPLLPLKLRLKNKHRSKEKRTHSKKRRRHMYTDTSRSSDSSSDSDSSRSRSKRYQHKKLLKKNRDKAGKRRKEPSTSMREDRDVVDSFDTEDSIPLSNLANKRKKMKYSDRRQKGHGSPSPDHHKRHKRMPESSADSDTSTNSGEETWEVENRNGQAAEDRTSSPECFRTPKREWPSCRYAIAENFSDRTESQPGSSNLSVSPTSLKVENDDKSHSDTDTGSTESMYKEYKPNVKSRINAVISEDSHKAGPSTSRLKTILKKEESSNLWYSRPYTCDSDSSDS